MPDRIHIEYDVPVSPAGHVRLVIDTSPHPSQLDAQFIIDVLGRVAEFAQIAAPAAVAPEIPSVLRGVGGRP